MIAAVARSWQPLYEGSEEPSDVVKAPKIKKNHASALRKFMRRICFLFLGKQKENHEDLTEVTIEKSETNPYFVPDSALSLYRMVPAPSATSENRFLVMPRIGPPTSGGPQIPRLVLPLCPQYLIDA
jgi:hypothetical protein